MMGLLDDFKQYVRDAMPGGLLNAEWTPKNVRNAGEAMSMIPNPVGDVASGLLAVDDLRKGRYGEAALNGLGLLPFVPAMGGIVKKVDAIPTGLMDKYVEKEVYKKQKQLAHDAEMLDEKLSALKWKSPDDVATDFRALKADELRSGMRGKDEFSMFFDTPRTPEQVMADAVDSVRRHYSDAMLAKWQDNWAKTVIENASYASKEQLLAAKQYLANKHRR